MIDGAYGYEGILEIHLETEWSAVCHDMDLTQDTIDGICHILGWQYGGKSVSIREISYMPTDPIYSLFF